MPDRMLRFAVILLLAATFAAPHALATIADPAPGPARDVSSEVAQAVAALKAGEPARAAGFLRPAAEAGDADAQALLGQLYLEGRGVARNLPEAGLWLRAAAANGQAEGTYLLAAATESGALSPPGMDPADGEARAREATRLYHAAATAGSLPAKVEMGLRYAKGEGTPPDARAASRWFREAAGEGNADAAFNLGVLHASGVLSGGSEDIAAALPWFEAAAESGHRDAQYNLGLIAAEGMAGPVDNAAAVRWFEAASAQGLAEAKTALADLVFQGLGTAKDEARAAGLYAEAANDGDAVAQHRLARLTLAGRGVAPDPAEAWKWHSLARAGGLADEGFEAELAAALTAAQREEGEARAARWQSERARERATATP